MVNNFRLWLLIVFIFFSLASSAASQGLPTAVPEEVGLSSERLERIKPAMQNYITQNKLSGIITMVARRGRVVHFETYGQMDDNKPMQYNTIFRIASMTKPVTSVAAMILYEEGYFQLTDPVSKFIPEFENFKVFDGINESGIKLVKQEKPITMKDLFVHTSGITYGDTHTPVDSMYNAASLNVYNTTSPEEGTLEEMIKKLAKLPLLYQPGTKFHYSMSTDVLGYVVEKISGKPLNEFFKERIFNPLKMNDTGFYLPDEKDNRFAAVYVREDNDTGIRKIVGRPYLYDRYKQTKLCSGGGGLYSTASDYIRFAQMLLNLGELEGTRILGRKTVEFMTRNHLSEEILPIHKNIPGVGWGLGFAVVLDAPQSGIIGSDGEYYWAGAYNTYFWINPEEELISLIMTQFQPFGSYLINKEFKVLVYQAIID